MSKPSDKDDGATIWIDDNTSYTSYSNDCSTVTISQDVIDSISSTPWISTPTMNSNVTISSTAVSHSTLTSNQYTTIGAVGANSTGNLAIGTSQGWNGTFSFGQPKLSIDAENEGVVFKTEKHSVNWDDLIDDIKSIKRAFMAMSNNDELMEKYPEIKDMLSDWLIKGLSK